MKRTFVVNLALLMGANLLIKPFWILGIDRGVQNTLGYEQYGMYANLFTFSMLLITMLDLGINSFTSSLIAKNKNNVKTYFAPLVVFKMISSLFYIGSTLLLGKVYGYDSVRLKLLLMLGFNQILSYFYLFFRSTAGGLQLFKTDALLSVTDRLLMIILCSAMLWGGLFNLSIERFIYAQTISYLAAASIAFYCVKSHLINISFVVNTTFLVSVLKQMLPYALLSLLMTLYTRLDNIMIQKLTVDGDFHNGVYASAFRLLEGANMMAALVSMLLLPIFSKMIERKEPLTPLVQLSSSILILPALLISTACFAYKNQIMYSLYNRNLPYAFDTFGIIIFCFVAFSAMYVFGTLLTANGSLKILNKLALFAIAINFILNIVLIKNYQAYGAAIAALITQTFIAVTNTYFGIKVLKITISKKYILGFLGSAAAFVAIVFCVQYIVKSWITGILIILCCGIPVMIVTRMLDIKQIITLLKERF